jgi:hypothetical protein
MARREWGVRNDRMTKADKVKDEGSAGGIMGFAPPPFPPFLSPFFLFFIISPLPSSLPPLLPPPPSALTTTTSMPINPLEYRPDPVPKPRKSKRFMTKPARAPKRQPRRY